MFCSNPASTTISVSTSLDSDGDSVYLTLVFAIKWETPNVATTCGDGLDVCSDFSAVEISLVKIVAEVASICSMLKMFVSTFLDPRPVNQNEKNPDQYFSLQ